MKKPTARFMFLVIIIADIFIWYRVVCAPQGAGTALHFLNVGQGDSELLEIPGPFSVITDAGPDNSVVAEVDAVSAGRRRIDLAILTHPQADHFNGFNYLLGRYSFGAILVNGRNDDPGVAEWDNFLRKARSLQIPLVVVGAGDRIHIGSTTITFLSPDARSLQSAELNDTGLVEYVKIPNLLTALLTADIDSKTEKQLVTRGGIPADILKVAHHGSAYSTSEEFLAAVRPKVAVIEVGKNNRYGHPGAETIKQLSRFSQNIFRTDVDGRISIVPTSEQVVKVYTQHSHFQK